MGDNLEVSMAQMVKRLPALRETRVQSMGQEDPLEKEMATHSTTLAWKIPWMEEPGGLQSMGPQSRTRLSDFTFFLSKQYWKKELNFILKYYWTVWTFSKAA